MSTSLCRPISTHRLRPRFTASLALALLLGSLTTFAQAEPMVVDLWPGKPPGDTQELPPEADRTTEKDGLVAGKRVMRIGNVSTPQLHIYRPAAGTETGAAVIICPGGGHHILAWDLEGTEVAEWLNTLGVTGIVLKYRVPFREPDRKWSAAVQDTQRALSLVRARAAEWKIDPARLGVCGFSAGGETAGRAALAPERFYDRVDAADDQPLRPNFALLIYPAYFTEQTEQGPRLRSDLPVTKDAPPMFLVHAFDDPVTPQSALLLASALKQANVPTELHLYPSGGHGYGLRPTEKPVTQWTTPASLWLKQSGFLNAQK
jgi:acetyl esterase/lipase